MIYAGKFRSNLGEIVEEIRSDFRKTMEKLSEIEIFAVFFEKL